MANITYLAHPWEGNKLCMVKVLQKCIFLPVCNQKSCYSVWAIQILRALQFNKNVRISVRNTVICNYDMTFHIKGIRTYELPDGGTISGMVGKSGNNPPTGKVKTSNSTASPATIFPLTISGYSCPFCQRSARTLVGFGTYLKHGFG